MRGDEESEGKGVLCCYYRICWRSGPGEKRKVAVEKQWNINERKNCREPGKAYISTATRVKEKDWPRCIGRCKTDCSKCDRAFRKRTGILEIPNFRQCLISLMEECENESLKTKSNNSHRKRRKCLFLFKVNEKLRFADNFSHAIQYGCNIHSDSHKKQYEHGYNEERRDHKNPA
jgi:hypothetical protein